MLKNISALLLLASLLAAAAISSRAAPVTETDPAHFKLEFENAAVRVIRADWGPREAFAGQLELGDLVAVRLAPANFRVTLTDGRRADRVSGLGAVLYAPATTIVAENLQDHRVVSILVELKSKGAGGTAAPGRIDPLMADPARHHLVFENDKVRVVRVNFGPGQSAPGFYDASAAVVVPLTPLHLEVAAADGRKTVTYLGFGQPVWMPGGRILPRNLADMHTEFVVIEPK